MGASRGGHSGRDEKPCGDDDKESEKEMESMKDRLFPFGNFAGTTHTEVVREVV